MGPVQHCNVPLPYYIEEVEPPLLSEVQLAIMETLKWCGAHRLESDPSVQVTVVRHHIAIAWAPANLLLPREVDDAWFQVKQVLIDRVFPNWIRRPLTLWARLLREDDIV